MSFDIEFHEDIGDGHIDIESFCLFTIFLTALAPN
jgi:hypothetical protein